ncbi:MAG: sigma-54 dependent transcriptional regulator [Desulfobacterales bacterium]
MAAARILVVDDELIMRESLARWLERDGHAVATAASGEEALAKCREARYDILLLDIKLEGMSGLEVLRRIKEEDPDAAVIMITAYGSIPTAIEAMKNGAADYLLKPFEPEELGVVIENLLRRREQARETLYLRERVREAARFENLIGQSPAMQQVFQLIADVAPTDAPVLIDGETGTGKGLAARAVHSLSARREGPFVAVHCAAIPETLMESELFGHMRGAFTDAKETKRGRLEMAHGGTLFLDEIGEVGMRTQIDLLRVLEDGVFYRVGGTQPLEADFRVIAATNLDLERAVREGRFRGDLFYRLNVVRITMPPLRHRKQDIPLLAEHFLRRYALEARRPVERIGRDALDAMMVYDWPGNVRELENAIERAVVVGKGPQIRAEDLPITARPSAPAGPAVRLEEVEREHIRRVLDECGWNITRSARRLGIDRSTLYGKIRRWGLRKPS